MSEPKNQLVRGLTLTHSTSIVICFVIGTGIFLKTAVMAQYVGSPILVLAAWVAAGLLSLAGALVYAELGAMIPKAGGEYVYLRAAYGDIPAFFRGWSGFIVGPAGSAAQGAAFAIFLSALFPISSVWIEYTFHLFGREILWQFGMLQVVAMMFILLCAAINCARVSFSGGVQSFFTFAKLSGVAIIIVGVFFLSKNATLENLATAPVTPQWSGSKAFGAAMIAALWAYNGWYALPMVAGEVQNPGRNIPRALIVGLLTIIIVYCLVNLAYFYALPFEEIVTSNSTQYPNAASVAGKAAQTFLGPLGLTFISIFFLVSSFGSLHSALLTTPRVTFAMARDGLFFSCFGTLSKNTRVPVFVIGIQAILSCGFAASGTFDQLTTMIIFSLWIFYGLTAASVFVLRRKMPDAPRPYRTLGYPVVPLIFVLVSLWLVINTLLTNPVESGLGVGLLMLGLPFYYYFRYKKRRENGAVIGDSNP